MADRRFSYEWRDPALHVEFSSAVRRQAPVDESARAVELFGAPVRQPRREMRIGMRVWAREVVRG